MTKRVNTKRVKGKDEKTKIQKNEIVSTGPNNLVSKHVYFHLVLHSTKKGTLSVIVSQ